MRKFSIGKNEYCFTSSIYLEEAPWNIFLLRSMFIFLLKYFPNITIPKFKIINLKDHSTTREFFHATFCTKIFKWCDKRTNSININFSYNLLKEMFPNDFEPQETFSEEEIKNNREYSEYVQTKFNLAYYELSKMTKKAGLYRKIC